MKAFHCLEPTERKIKFTTLVASLTTYEVFYDIDEDDKTEEKRKKVKSCN